MVFNSNECISNAIPKRLKGLQSLAVSYKKLPKTFEIET
jgi:hypothetical protein